ncbi:MAG: VCBS repeat-containing protein, partial [Nitrospirae bacterium]|nr:VCBS repeat-containing protein [Nitrospirota bacterium]
GDGTSDILLMNGDTISIMFMSGLNNVTANEVQNGNLYNSLGGSGWKVKSIGDYNGDGRDEILVENGDGSVYIISLNVDDNAFEYSYISERVPSGWNIKPDIINSAISASSSSTITDAVSFINSRNYSEDTLSTTSPDYKLFVSQDIKCNSNLINTSSWGLKADILEKYYRPIHNSLFDLLSKNIAIKTNRDANGRYVGDNNVRDLAQQALLAGLEADSPSGAVKDVLKTVAETVIKNIIYGYFDKGLDQLLQNSEMSDAITKQVRAYTDNLEAVLTCKLSGTSCKDAYKSAGNQLIESVKTLMSYYDTSMTDDEMNRLLVSFGTVEKYIKSCGGDKNLFVSGITTDSSRQKNALEILNTCQGVLSGTITEPACHVWNLFCNHYGSFIMMYETDPLICYAMSYSYLNDYHKASIASFDYNKPADIACRDMLQDGVGGITGDDIQGLCSQAVRSKIDSFRPTVVSQKIDTIYAAYLGSRNLHITNVYPHTPKDNPFVAKAKIRDILTITGNFSTVPVRDRQFQLWLRNGKNHNSDTSLYGPKLLPVTWFDDKVEITIPCLQFNINYDNKVDKKYYEFVLVSFSGERLWSVSFILDGPPADKCPTNCKLGSGCL